MYKKCTEQSFFPSNFDKLEEAFFSIQRLNEELRDCADKVIHFNDLKHLHDKLTGFRKTPEFKVMIDRYNKACSLKQAISIFWKTQTCKTRGSIEERFDISKGMDILKQSEILKVELDNTDKFRERITSIYNLLSDIERFLSGSDDEKSMKLVIEYSNKLSEFGIETPMVLRLNVLRDSLHELENVDKRLSSLAEADANFETLKRVYESGFRPQRLAEMLNFLRELIKWKTLYTRFVTPPQAFSVSRLINFDYILTNQEELMSFLHPRDPSIITPEISRILQTVKHDYDEIRTRVKNIRPQDDVLHKLDLCQLICTKKMMDDDIKNFLMSTIQEIRYYVEVLSLMGSILGWQYQLLPKDKFEETLRHYQTSGVMPKHVTWYTFADHIRRLSEELLGLLEPQPFITYRIPSALLPSMHAKGSLLQSINDNLERLEYISTPVYQALKDLRKEIQDLVDEGALAIEQDDEAKIKQVEVRIKDYHLHHEIQQEFAKCLECFKWRRDTDELISEIAAKDPEVDTIAERILSLVADLSNREPRECDMDTITQAYQQNKAALGVLFKRGLEIRQFYKYEKLSKLISEEKTFRESSKNRKLREKLKEMKDTVDRVDADLHAAAANTREELLVMMYLGYVGMAYTGGIRTGPIITILEKVEAAVSCEVESQSEIFTIEQIKDRIQNFKFLKIWTPFYNSLLVVEEWYKKLKDAAQKVISKVTKVRLIYRSKLVEKMISSNDYEFKVNAEVCEISIKKCYRDRGSLQNGAKRDKKKSSFMVNASMGLVEHKPAKLNKDLIEEMDFNDYEEKVELLCFCNRRKLLADFSKFRQDDSMQHL